MKIIFESNKLRNETKPKINNAITNLNDAISLLEGIEIPDGFLYASELRNIPSQINQIENDITGINEYIEQKIGEFEAARRGILSSNLNWLPSYMQGTTANEINTNTDPLNWSLSYQGGGTPEVGYGGYGISITELKRTGASVANLFVSGIKGVADFGEALIDTGAVVVSAPLTIITAGQDIAQGLKSGKGLKDINFKNTKDLWAGTMSMVAEDTVGNAFSKFYEKTKVGKWLDTNAYTPFKSTGAVTKVAEGLGQILGVVGLTLLTGGAATPAMAAKVSAGIAGTRGFGEGAEYLWGKQRDSSWAGLERLKERGEISKEKMETYKAIRNMSLSEINDLYKTGKVDVGTYTQMLNIKQMPEDWKTTKNLLSGITYAGAIGGWEALQFYVGNKMNNFSIKGAPALANATTRVGIDTGFNATDTPYRAGVESLLTKRNFKEIFDEQGGTKAVWISVGIGGLGSIGGEFLQYRNDKMKKGILEELDKNFKSKFGGNPERQYLETGLILLESTKDKKQRTIIKRNYGRRSLWRLCCRKF